PAPAGAICVLLPIYLASLGGPVFPAVLTAFYALVVAFLMVSRLPVFSGKTIGTRVPRELVLPLFVLVILVVALLIGYPWYVLSFGTVLYLLSLPAGYYAYRAQEQRALQANAAVPPPAADEAFHPASEPNQADRPTRFH